MERFLKNLAKHPGTWIFLALLSIGIGMIVPVAAPGLMITAAIFTGIAVPPLVLFYWKHNREGLPYRNKEKWRINRFIFHHPMQLAIAIIGFGLFVTALVLTIGFLTGGVGFMAPIFAAIAAPFAVAATSAGIQLALTTLAGIILVFASISVPHALKRFSAWSDSFIYDAAAARWTEDKNIPYWVTLTHTWGTDRYIIGNAMINNKDGNFSLINYLSVFAEGVKATMTHKGFNSPDAELLEQELNSKKYIEC